MSETKVCSKCGRILPVDNFYKDSKAKDGLQCWCRECCSKYRQTYNQTHKEYYKQYYQTNKEHRNQYQKGYNREYYKQYKGYYLYIILNKQGNIVYVGQTTNYYTRLMKHLSKDVNATKELFDSGDWGSIKYLDVGDIVANDLELRAMENILIELYNPRLNTLKNIIRDIDNDRLFSLVATLHSILNEWITFKTNTN